MKKIILGLMVVFVVSSSDTVLADKTTPIPIEASALVQNATYHQLLLEQLQLVSNTGRTLRIVAFSTLDLGISKYVYAHLATKITAIPCAVSTCEWTPAGSIAGSMQYGPMGEIIFDAVFFKPQAGLPGGASVGNN